MRTSLQRYLPCQQCVIKTHTWLFPQSSFCVQWHLAQSLLGRVCVLPHGKLNILVIHPNQDIPVE